MALRQSLHEGGSMRSITQTKAQNNPPEGIEKTVLGAPAPSGMANIGLFFETFHGLSARAHRLLRDSFIRVSAVGRGDLRHVWEKAVGDMRTSISYRVSSSSALLCETSIDSWMERVRALRHARLAWTWVCLGIGIAVS